MLLVNSSPCVINDYPCWLYVVHGWFWIGLSHQRVSTYLPILQCQSSSMTPQWNIISLGKGIYHIKCVKRGFYVGWEEEDFHDRAKVVMSKTPSRWTITSFSNGNYQYVTSKLIFCFHACVQGGTMQILGCHKWQTISATWIRWPLRRCTWAVFHTCFLDCNQRWNNNYILF